MECVVRRGSVATRRESDGSGRAVFSMPELVEGEKNGAGADSATRGSERVASEASHKQATKRLAQIRFAYDIKQDEKRHHNIKKIYEKDEKKARQ